ncbi:hypothetical protein HETIRDRAFT_438704 [Heterobasidion irregulare TC 32-1]|uniref:Uncharacterized protein n=1 Tax=Heterobasidion irregulare (strain TC 32-1) TaxID=747525 RepID=W4KKF8_HETIT|nr:uncharacterized protein HETIRDRAFT_438704 [Heterobasidion irregulare TC 32-1]ETW86323.1 hypothetical protein HETIRDRAFT_438704 [Heterobasidion irregulare TC 32-1]
MTRSRPARRISLYRPSAAARAPARLPASASLTPTPAPAAPSPPPPSARISPYLPSVISRIGSAICDPSSTRRLPSAAGALRTVRCCATRPSRGISSCCDLWA